MRNLVFLIIIFCLFQLNAETVLEEGFETGVLPEGWTQEYVDGSVNWAYTNGGYNANPDFAYEGFLNARFFNTSTDGVTTKLVTKEFNLGINEVGTLTFYHAQHSWVGYQDELSIYYKNSVDGEWIFLTSYTANTTDWTFRQVGLPNPSTTYYVAFEGYAEYGYGVCLDNVHVDGDPMYEYDLQGLTIDGPQNVTAGNSESYAVTIQNVGINPVSEYTVSIYREGDIQVATADFTDEIGVGSVETRYVVWNIPAAEPETYTYIYGVVSFPEDENVYNNNTTDFDIHILPQGTEYLAEVDFESGELPAGWTQEYVSGNNDWEVQSGGYTGNPPGAHGGEYNAAFLHLTTGNTTRLISPDFNLGTANNGTLNFWHAQAVYAGDQDELHIYYRTAQNSPWTLIESFTGNTPDWTERNVTLPNPSTTYSVAFEAVDGWGYGVCLDDIIIIGQPTVYDNDLAGQVISGAEIVNAGNSEIYQVLIKNVGELPQNSYSVNLFKLGNEELASIEVNQTIQPGELVSHDLQWNIPADEPTGTTQLYAGVELVGDENTNNDLTPTLSIEIFPQGIIEIEVGDGTEQNTRLPVCFEYLNSLTESIYLSSELNNLTGFINEITYYNNFVDNLQQQPVSVWMGETTLVTLVDGWIPASQLTQVFNGNVNFPPGENEININLTTPYYYEGNNLVVMVHRPMDDNSYSSSDYFYLTHTPEIMDRTRYERDDVMILDPFNPPEGYSFEKFPNTKFTFYQGSMGDVSGYIYDEDNNPLEGATVTIEQTQQIAYTNESGMFFLGNVLVGNYDFTANAFGYTSQTLNGEVVEGEILDLTFNLSPLGVVNVSGTVVGSDFPDIGLEGAIVSLSGFDSYETNTDAEGNFTIQEVYASLAYDITIIHEEYNSYEGEVNVPDVDLDVGTLILNEITEPPTNVQGEQNLQGNAVTLTWNGPGVGGSEFRYDDGDAVGQIGFSDTPTNAAFGAVHQHNAVIEEVHWYLTSTFGSHNNVKLILLGLTGSGLPNSEDLLHLTGNIPNSDDQWNNYVLPEPVQAPNGFLVGVITTNQYTGIGLDDGVGTPWEFIPGTQMASENWSSETPDWTDIGEYNFEQNMMIRAYGLDYGVTASVNLEMNSEREFEAYAVYRFPQAYQNNQNYWVQLSDTVMDTSYIDLTWPGLDPGQYQYAVTSVHTNGVESIPSFSNVINKTTPADAEDPTLPAKTQLFANVPNPFNPETMISFRISNEQNEQGEPPVLVVYNIRGQKVKEFIVTPSLCHPSIAGRGPERSRRIGSNIYQVTWNGTDDNNQPVSSGIYFYKLKAGDGELIRKMVLLK